MLKILLVCLLVPTSLWAHGGHRADVTIAPGDTATLVEVFLPTPDLERVMQDPERCGPEQDRMVCEATYLASTITITVNNERRPLYLESISRTAERTVIRFTLAINPSTIQSISVRSTCLWEHDTNYRTIVQVRLDEPVSYELTHDQPSFEHQVR